MPTTFDISRSGFAIRSAAAADAAACRMLLPELPENSLAWVATDGKRRLVVAAAGLVLAPRVTPLLGFGAAVHVIAPCRGKRIGTALVEQLQAAARERGGQALYAAKRVEFGSEEMAGWERLGFSMCETIEEHMVALAEFETRLGPLFAKLRGQGRIPATARIVPLYQADREQVLQLHQAHLGGDRASLERKLAGQGEGAFHVGLSRALLLDERVVGCVLAHRKSPSTFAVDATILAPEVRGGWASIWLKLEASRGAPAGVTHFCYSTFDRYGDTRRFTQTLGGETIRSSALMYRPL